MTLSELAEKFPDPATEPYEGPVVVESLEPAAGEFWLAVAMIATGADQ